MLCECCVSVVVCCFVYIPLSSKKIQPLSASVSLFISLSLSVSLLPLLQYPEVSRFIDSDRRENIFE